MRIHKHAGLFIISIALCTSMISCTGSSEVHTKIHTAYFIDSSTVGIFISNYMGGGGGWLSPDEHVHDYNQRLVQYDIKTGKQTSGAILSEYAPFGDVNVVTAGNMLITNLGMDQITAFSYYTLKGINKRAVLFPVLPSGFLYVTVCAISADARYLFAYSRMQKDSRTKIGYIFNMSSYTWSQPFSISSTSIDALENNGANYITADWFTAQDIRLVRNSFASQSSETLLDITNYQRIASSQHNKLLFKNPSGYAGYFIIDTLSNPKARFNSLNVKSSIVDFDTLSGRYLAQTETEVFLGNFKTGEIEKSIYSF